MITNYVIYLIKNKANGKCYVGSTSNFRKRKDKHLSFLRTNSKKVVQTMVPDFQFYGENIFDFSILKYLTQEELPFLDNIENAFIIEYESNNPEKGYNKVLVNYNKEQSNSIKTISQGKKESYLFSAPPNLTQMSAEDWIQNRRNNPEFKVPTYIPVENPIIRKKKVFKICKENYIIIDSFDSISEAAESINMEFKDFQRVVKKNTSDVKFLYSIKDFIYALEENFSEDLDFTLFKGKTHHNTKEKVLKEKPIKVVSEINIVNTTTNEIKTFNQYSDIANFLEVDRKRLNELKIGYKNKGGGKISNVTHIKGWKFA